MKIQKCKVNGLLHYWLKSDQKLHKKLSVLHIKVLHERIIQEMSFKELANQYKTSVKNVKKVYTNALERAKACISPPLYHLIVQIQNQLELKEISHQFTPNYQSSNIIILN